MFRCCHKRCKVEPFICRINRFGNRLALCEEHWNFIEILLGTMGENDEN